MLHTNLAILLQQVAEPCHPMAVTSHLAVMVGVVLFVAKNHRKCGQRRQNTSHCSSTPSVPLMAALAVSGSEKR